MCVRVIASGASGSSRVPERLSFAGERDRAKRSRTVYFGPDAGRVDTPVCERSVLDWTWRTGPLLIEEFDSTTVVPPDGRARLIAWDTLEIELA